VEGRGARAGERLNAAQSLLQYGYLLLFAFVLAEQAGLPVPAVPILLGVGALTGSGRMSMTLAFAAALAASLPPDVVWYELGRRRGGRVLAILCRISLEPDSCVRNTENLFLRRGRGALLVAKFFPGLSTVAPPLAGMVGIARWQFLVLDIAAAILWAGTWMTLGYIFSDALELVASWAGRLGNSLGLVVGVALAGYVAYKFIQRRRFLRSLRVARITPEELRRRLDVGDEPLAIIDTRSALDVNAEPYAIPGALWIPAEDISRRQAELPRGRELVLYCS
jgi:membrane protein DedA with SNARE-associated domain